MKETLTKQQWAIMEALWQNSPVFLSELMDALRGKVSWTYTTFLTYLKKMVDRGFITYTTVRGSRRYEPAISREDCMVNESRSLLSRMTETSAALFVSNMIREGSLSKQDRDDLRGLIDELDRADEEQ